VAEPLIEEAADQEVQEFMGKAPHGWDKSEGGMTSCSEALEGGSRKDVE
jgi:hypothetical protein